MTSLLDYEELSRDTGRMPLFLRSWWLDATAGRGRWDVALVKEAGETVAAMPYLIRRRFGITAIGQPPLTQRLGPWILQRGETPFEWMSYENDMMMELIDRLPRFDHFNQNWQKGLKNWLPFYWKGFQQTTRYTYVLPDLSDLGEIWNGFAHNTRTQCLKAIHRFELVVRDDLPLSDFLELNRMSFERQSLEVPYPEALVRKLDAACEREGCRKFFIAVDPMGRNHAAIYVVWDEDCAYGLMSGADPVLRTSGAATLCVWEAIKYVSRVTRAYDFGGSMIAPIERFVRGFGPVQVPYFNISKTPSSFLRFKRVLQTISGSH